MGSGEDGDEGPDESWVGTYVSSLQGVYLLETRVTSLSTTDHLCKNDEGDGAGLKRLFVSDESRYPVKTNQSFVSGRGPV